MALEIVKRAIDLRPGEAKTAGLVAGVLALVVGAHTMLETARDALFLSKLPPSRLTLVYALLAVLALVASAASNAFARRFGRRTSLVFTLLACAYATVIFYVRASTPAAVFGFYVLTGVMGTILLLQFWTFAAQLFTVAQGKRLFGPIASGGVIGATAGASAAVAILRAYPVKSLLLVAPLLFLVAAAFLAAAPEESRPAAATSALDGLRDFGVLGDPYVRRVAFLAAIGTATVLVVDYLFKSVAAASMPKSELGSFFASFYAIQNGISLVVQLFLTSFIVARVGVPTALLVLPFCLTCGGTASLALGGSLAATLAAKGADGSLRHSLHRVTSELLLLPLSSETRDRAKPLLDTVFGRGIQAVTAGVLFSLGATGYATPRILGGGVALLGGGWLFAAMLVRRPYVDVFRRALSRGTLSEPVQGDLDLESVEELLESLSSRDEERVLAALELLEFSGRTRLVPGLVLYHDSPRVLERALGIVSSKRRTDWVPLAERLLEHRDPEVRSAAIRALAASEEANEETVKRRLEDESEVVRAEAAFFLAKRHGADEPARDPLVRDLCEARGDAARRARTALLSVIADHGDARWAGVVATLLDGGDLAPGSAAAAALAIGRVGDVRFLPWLVSELAVRDGRGQLRDAIVSFGERGFEAVRAAMEDPATDARVRLQLPRTVARFANQEAVDYLTRRLAAEKSGAVRYKILRGLGRLSSDGVGAKGERLRFERGPFEAEVAKSLEEHLRLLGFVVAVEGGDASSHEGTGAHAVLAALLADKARQALERAFLLLALAHRNEDIRGVYAALEGKDRRARANALEFLDALLQARPDLRALVRVAADDLEVREKVRRAAAFVDAKAPVVREEALRRLIADPDDLLAALAAYASLDLGLVGLRDDVSKELLRRPKLFQLGAKRRSAGRNVPHAS